MFGMSQDVQTILDYAKSIGFSFLSKAYTQGYALTEQYILPTLRSLLSNHPDVASTCAQYGLAVDVLDRHESGAIVFYGCACTWSGLGCQGWPWGRCCEDSERRYAEGYVHGKTVCLGCGWTSA